MCSSDPQNVLSVSFCGCEETVDHLFIRCPFARLVWCVLFCAYNIPHPTNATNLFGNWLNGVGKKTKGRIRIGVSALCWSIWNYRNNLVSNRNFFFMFYRLSIWRRIGYSYGHAFYPRPARSYGYLVYPNPDGCTGYLLPGYVTAY